MTPDYRDLKEVALFLTQPNALPADAGLALYVSIGGADWSYRGGCWRVVQRRGWGRAGLVKWVLGLPYSTLESTAGRCGPGTVRLHWQHRPGLLRWGKGASKLHGVCWAHASRSHQDQFNTTPLSFMPCRIRQQYAPIRRAAAELARAWRAAHGATRAWLCPGDACLLVCHFCLPLSMPAFATACLHHLPALPRWLA